MTEEERKLLEELVDKELFANNYFMHQYNMANPFHERLMDFAALYCMEYYNMNYRYELVKEEERTIERDNSIVLPDYDVDGFSYTLNKKEK